MADKRLCVSNDVYKVARKMLGDLIERFISDPEAQIRFEKLLRPYARYLEIGTPYQHKVLLAINQATEDDLIKYGFWPEIVRLRSMILAGQISPHPESICPVCGSDCVDLEHDGTLTGCRACGWKLSASVGKTFDESDVEARFE